jgi:hypothetical protein
MMTELMNLFYLRFIQDKIKTKLRQNLCPNSLSNENYKNKKNLITTHQT